MAKGGVNIPFDGNSDRALAAVDALKKRLGELERQLTDTSESSRKLSREEQQAAREAKRAYEASLTPLQKHEQHVKALDGALRKKKITQEQYDAAVRKSAASMENAGKAGNAAFGPRALSQLKSYAAGFLTINAAAGVFQRVLEEIDQKRQEWANKQKESRMGLGSLAQVATSAQDMQHLIRSARQVYLAGGAESMDEAGQIVFQARSAGQESYLPLIQELKATGMVGSPQEMVKAITAIQTAMGSGETGEFRGMVSKALAASASTHTSAEDLLLSSTRAAGSAAALGISDEELLASTAVASKAMRSAEEGGTRVAAFLRALEKTPVEGATLEEKVRSIETLDAAGQGDLLKDAEALQGFRLISQNMGLYRQTLAAQTSAVERDEVGQRLQFYMSDPALLTARQEAQSKAAAELSGQGEGVARNRVETLQQYNDAAARAAGLPAWMQTVVGWGVDAGQKFAGDQAVLGAVGDDEGLRQSARAQGALLDASRNLNQAAQGGPTLAPVNDDPGLPVGR